MNCLAHKTADVSKMLNIDQHKLSQLRKYGVLKGIKVGKGYVYSDAEINRFLTEYEGADLSNERCIEIEIAKRKRRC